MTIPFSIFEALSTLTIVDDIKVYTFNFELFMKWLPLIKLRGPALLFMVAAAFVVCKLSGNKSHLVKIYLLDLLRLLGIRHK